MRLVHQNPVFAFACAIFAFAATSSVTTLAQTPAQNQAWVGSWASAQQIPEPQNALPPAKLTDATLREIVHLSVGGSSHSAPSRCISPRYTLPGLSRRHRTLSSPAQTGS
jgi:hypothetical protein